MNLTGDARRRFAARHARACLWWAPHCRHQYRGRVWAFWNLFPWYCKLCVSGLVVRWPSIEGTP